MLKKADRTDAAVILIAMEGAEVEDRNPRGIAAIVDMKPDRCKELCFRLASMGLLLQFSTHFTIGFKNPSPGMARIMRELEPVVKTMIR